MITATRFLLFYLFLGGRGAVDGHDTEVITGKCPKTKKKKKAAHGKTTHASIMKTTGQMA